MPIFHSQPSRVDRGESMTIDRLSQQAIVFWRTGVQMVDQCLATWPTAGLQVAYLKALQQAVLLG